MQGCWGFPTDKIPKIFPCTRYFEIDLVDHGTGRQIKGRFWKYINKQRSTDEEAHNMLGEPC